MVTYFCYSCEPLNHQVMRNAQVTVLWFCKTQSLFLYQCSRALWLTDHQNNMEECRVFGVSGYLCLYDQTADRYDDQCKALLWNGRKRSRFLVVLMVPFQLRVWKNPTDLWSDCQPIKCLQAGTSLLLSIIHFIEMNESLFIWVVCGKRRL